MTDPADLSLVFLEIHPAGAGQVLEELAPADAAALVEHIPHDTMASVFAHMQTARAVKILIACTPSTAAEVLVRTQPHIRTALLRALPASTKDQVLTALPKREAAALRRYLAYDPGSVGAWMSAPKTTLKPDATVGQSIQRLRRLRDRPGARLFITDNNRKLVGAVDVDALVVADDGVSVGDLAQSHLDGLSPHSPLAGVLKRDEWDKTLTMPVTDRADRLLGVLTFDALREGLLAEREGQGTPQLQASAMMLQVGEALLVSVAGLTRTAVAPSTTRRIDGAAP